MDMYHNGIDYVVANSPEDAISVWNETTGDDWKDYQDEGVTWEKVDSEEIISVRFFFNEESSIVPQGAVVREMEGGCKVEATSKAWVDKYGRGFLCSEEY